MTTARILQAVEFAIEAHAGQLREHGVNEPYVLHPVRVARTIQQAGGSEDMIIAALFHDIIEDCNPCFEPEILKQFGEKVYDIVLELTDTPLSAGNRAQRKLMDLHRLAHASAAAQTIKCADSLDNTPSIMENDKNFAPLYLQEKLRLIPALTKANRKLWKQAMDMLNGYKLVYDIQKETENV